MLQAVAGLLWRDIGPRGDSGVSAEAADPASYAIRIAWGLLAATLSLRLRAAAGHRSQRLSASPKDGDRRTSNSIYRHKAAGNESALIAAWCISQVQARGLS